MPKVDGLEVLRRIRADPRTRVVPVVVLTSSKQKTTSAAPTTSVPTATSASPSTSSEFSEAVHAVGLFWLLLNRSPDPSPEQSWRKQMGPSPRLEAIRGRY